MNSRFGSLTDLNNKSGIFGKTGNEKIEGYISDINTAGKMLLNLVNSILDISRIESGKKDGPPSQADIRSAIKESADLISVLASDKEISLIIDCPDFLPTIEADPRQLSQIIINLVSNAVKYTPAGGEVVCSARVLKKGSIEIEVKDNGVGISEADQSRMFEPFERAGDAFTSREQGTGLGLTLARRLTEMNGGSISLSSEKNVGTSVKLTFRTN